MTLNINPFQRLIGFLVFAIFSAICFFIADQQREENAELQANGIDVRARVVRVDSHTRTKDGKTRTTYTPVFGFTDLSGSYQEIPQDWSSRPASHGVGDVVDFCYHPNRPGLGRVNSFWSMHGKAIGLGVLGTLFGLVALAYLTTPGVGMD